MSFVLVGHFHVHFPAIEVGAVEHVEHGLGLLFGHFEEGEVLHEVDASEVDVCALCHTVDEAHEDFGVDAVFLAQIDEETGVACLGCASALSATTATVATTALVTESVFVATAVTFLGGLEYFGRILVVVEEGVELHGHHALDEVFLLHEVELAEHFGEEGGYLLFVHLHLLDVVNHFQQLLGTYLLTSGQDARHKFLLNLLFDGTHLAFLLHMDDGDGCA